jgi:hypothetical protein
MSYKKDLSDNKNEITMQGENKINKSIIIGNASRHDTITYIIILEI